MLVTLLILCLTITGIYGFDLVQLKTGNTARIDEAVGKVL